MPSHNNLVNQSLAQFRPPADRNVWLGGHRSLNLGSLRKSFGPRRLVSPTSKAPNSELIGNDSLRAPP